jgi:hypothetical protein
MLGPNITGGLNGIFYNGSEAGDGAFAPGTFGATYVNGNSGNYRSANIGFMASRYNSIYKDSGHVYPLSLALNFIIKA